MRYHVEREKATTTTAKSYTFHIRQWETITQAKKYELDSIVLMSVYAFVCSTTDKYNMYIKMKMLATHISLSTI